MSETNNQGNAMEIIPPAPTSTISPLKSFMLQKVIAMEFTPYKVESNIDPTKTGVKMIKGYEDYRKFTSTIENFLQAHGLLKIAKEGKMSEIQTKSYLTNLLGGGEIPDELMVKAHMDINEQKDVACMRIIKAHCGANIQPSLINFKTSKEIYKHLDTIYGIRIDDAKRNAKEILSTMKIKYDSTKKRVLESLPDFLDRFISAKNEFAYYNVEGKDSYDWNVTKEIDFLLDAMALCWPVFTKVIRNDYLKLGTNVTDAHVAELYDIIKREDEKDPSYREHLKGSKVANVVQATANEKGPKQGNPKGNPKSTKNPKGKGSKEKQTESANPCGKCKDAKFRKCITCNLCGKHGHFQNKCSEGLDDPEVQKLVRDFIAKRKGTTKRAKVVNSVSKSSDEDIDDEESSAESEVSTRTEKKRKRDLKAKSEKEKSKVANSVSYVDSPLRRSLSKMSMEIESDDDGDSAGEKFY